MGMRIGVDATCWQNRRGYGRHARALLGALLRLDFKNRYTFFLDSIEENHTLPAGAEVVLLDASRPAAVAASASGRRSVRDMWRMSCALSSRAFDVLIFPTIYSYVPVFSRARKLVMIHDIIAETYPQLTVPRFSARLFWKTKVGLGRLQADALITVSEYSRQGILRHFKSDPDRVFVVGEAGDPVFRRLSQPRLTPRLAKLGIDPNRRMVVYVGGFSPHKNLEPLVDAFARLAARDSFRDTVLVMVGEYEKEVFHSYFSTIAAQVDRLGIRDRVIFTGYLSDEDLTILLNLAAVLVLPSLMEGFGLPAVEAAACGCPVIATKASPLPALLGEGGLYVDPCKPEPELQGVMEQVLSSEPLRMRMRQAGQAAAQRLTWDAAASQMMHVIERVAQ